ncbi:class F sortase [Bacillus sp. P14.5]|uniref:class F sortase n=1 Tax=Bacillus sp. P14.5 TaxID=1983400 RepID=UPI000DEB9746|nr:class F sortase [Bacillus sp. P14.5]
MLKKRLAAFAVIILTAGVIGYQALAQEEPKAIPQSKPEEQAAEVEKVPQKDTGIKPIVHKEDEFVLLDSLQKKKAQYEKEMEIQEEGIVPARIKIPSMDIDTGVTPVGLLDNGEMEVPEETDITGWFDRGVKPGAKGNAVIAGHVDSKEGPAIFFYLKDIEIGEIFTIFDENGKEKRLRSRRKKAIKMKKLLSKKYLGRVRKET